MSTGSLEKSGIRCTLKLFVSRSTPLPYASMPQMMADCFDRPALVRPPDPTREARTNRNCPTTSWFNALSILPSSVN
ncbi:unnamed protein product [Protopolystoma xenopodis]|uniref:Uncharacterized protein n=1 Tax=Protopolystoma xenopodis TaxID=117903 RepID=A0A3S4ZRS6_9PLAT|nr:unnamed protein product [Protopolystoma xenopodis]